jgi:hypothetical protein
VGARYHLSVVPALPVSCLTGSTNKVDPLPSPRKPSAWKVFATQTYFSRTTNNGAQVRASEDPEDCTPLAHGAGPGKAPPYPPSGIAPNQVQPGDLKPSPNARDPEGVFAEALTLSGFSSYRNSRSPKGGSPGGKPQLLLSSAGPLLELPPQRQCQRTPSPSTAQPNSLFRFRER